MLELVANHVGDTFRAVYTVKFATAIYVLHAFQKKSKSGIKTPTEDMELVQRRLKAAEADYKAQLEKGKASQRKTRMPASSAAPRTFLPISDSPMPKLICSKLNW